MGMDVPHPPFQSVDQDQVFDRGVDETLELVKWI